MTLLQRLKLRLLVYMLRNHSSIFPNTEFDLNSWEEGSEDGRTCGTAACAVGSAMFWWPIRLLGLQAKEYGGGFVPKYKKWDNWTAVIKFFGLSSKDADYLFDISNYEVYDPTADQVADRILNYLKGNKEPQYA